MTARLPPTGWADVATRRDLKDLGDTLRLEMRAESNALRADVNEKLRTHLAVIMGLNISLAGVVIAFLR